MSDRAAFYDQFFAASREFAAQLLQLIPELEGIAIVPAWKTQQPQLPFGLIRGADGPLHRPSEVMHMAVGLHGALNHVMQASAAMVQAVDNQLGRMAADLKQVQEQLRAAKPDPDPAAQPAAGND